MAVAIVAVAAIAYAVSRLFDLIDDRLRSQERLEGLVLSSENQARRAAEEAASDAGGLFGGEIIPGLL
jgi:hypothetical protein